MSDTLKITAFADYYKIKDELDCAKDEIVRLKDRSIELDPSLTDKFELREGSVFVLRNMVAHLAGVSTIADLQIVKERDQLRAEVDRLGQQLFESREAQLRGQNGWIRTEKERDQWKAMAERLQHELRGALHDGTEIMFEDHTDIYRWDYHDGEQALAAYEELKGTK